MTDSDRRPARSISDRVISAYPLMLAYLVLLILYGWQTTKHATPWNFTDELKWALLSRSIAHTGHAMEQGGAASAGSLYAYFLAPAWWAGATAPSYAAAKYLNAAAMTAALFPAYGLARLVVPRPAAIVSAIASVAVPALAYTGLLVPESLAYAWSTLALFLIARALTRPTWLGAALAMAAVIIAPFIKSQLRVVVLGAAISAALAFAWSDRGRALRATWTRGERVGAWVLLVGVVIFTDALFGQHSTEWYVGTHFWHRAFTYGLWAIGAFAIGVGIVPVVLALAWAFDARIEQRTDRALLAVFVGSVVSTALYAAVKASYESTIFSTRVWERNVIYLSPIVFVAAARYFYVGRRSASVLAAGALTAYLLATTPYHAYEHFYSDAPGLSILQWLNRTWSFTNTDLRRLLFGILAFGIVVGLLIVHRRRWVRPTARRGTAALVALTVVGVIAWNLTGEIAAANSSNSFAKTIVALPQPPDWIDRATGRQRAVFVGQEISNSNAFWSIEFWNQSLTDIWTVDGSSTAVGPTWTPNFGNTAGVVSGPFLSDRWGVAPGNVGLAGRVVERAGGLTLSSLAHPIRITHFSSSVYPDGWMGDHSSYVVFGRQSDKPGTAFVTLSRKAACGDIAAAHVTIKVSRLLIDRNAQPGDGTTLATRRVVVRSKPCQRRVVAIRVRPPFRMDLTASGLFHPADRRALSVQVGYAFRRGG